MENENEELLQNSETENVDTQTTEENVDNVIDNDSESFQETEVEEVEQNQPEDKKSFRDVLKDNPEYQEEFNKIMKNRLMRQENNLKADYEKKYQKINNVLKYGLGSEDIDDAANQLEEFYKDRGKEIPDIKATDYSEIDTEKLAKIDAEEIIDLGLDEIKYETERLKEKGIDNMTNREKLTFKYLAEQRMKMEDEIELQKVGAKKETYESKDYKEFAKKFEGSKFTAKEIYDLYQEKQPRNEVKPLGSMINNNSDNSKKYYTPEEAQKLTEKDLDDPEVYKNLRESMKKWK